VNLWLLKSQLQAYILCKCADDFRRPISIFLLLDFLPRDLILRVIVPVASQNAQLFESVVVLSRSFVISPLFTRLSGNSFLP
jgi:hypothetical protein